MTSSTNPVWPTRGARDPPLQVLRIETCFPFMSSSLEAEILECRAVQQLTLDNAGNYLGRRFGFLLLLKEIRRLLTRRSVARRENREWTRLLETAVKMVFSSCIEICTSRINRIIYRECGPTFYPLIPDTQLSEIGSKRTGRQKCRRGSKNIWQSCQCIGPRAGAARRRATSPQAGRTNRSSTPWINWA